MTDATARITGTDLLLLRTKARIKQTAIARHWPCTRTNIARVEASRRPTQAAIDKYLAALEAAEAEQ